MPALAAGPADFVPPPGLYRIDTDTHAAMRLGAIAGQGQVHEDGASGDTSMRGALAGGPTQSGSFKGTGPSTQCVRPVTSQAPLAGINAGAACVAKGGVVENGAFVIRQNCAQDNYEITIRKIGKSTWEYKTDVLLGATPASAQSSEAAVVAMLRAARAHARTEQERKEMDATLAEYASRSKEDRVAPSMPSPTAAGALVRRTVVLQKWTRIADRCEAPKT